MNTSLNHKPQGLNRKQSSTFMNATLMDINKDQ